MDIHNYTYLKAHVSAKDFEQIERLLDDGTCHVITNHLQKVYGFPQAPCWRKSFQIPDHLWDVAEYQWIPHFVTNVNGAMVEASLYTPGEEYIFDADGEPSVNDAQDYFENQFSLICIDGELQDYNYRIELEFTTFRTTPSV